MNENRENQIWANYLAGEPLSPEDERVLLEAFQSDGTFRQEVLRDARTDGLLRVEATPAAESESLIDSVFERMAAEKDATGFINKVETRIDEDAGAVKTNDLHRPGTRRGTKRARGRGNQKHLLPALLAAGVLFGVVVLFSMSSPEPSPVGPAKSEAARKAAERQEAARRDALRKRAEEDQAVAERARKEAEAQLTRLKDKEKQAEEAQKAAATAQDEDLRKKAEEAFLDISRQRKAEEEQVARLREAEKRADEARQALAKSPPEPAPEEKPATQPAVAKVGHAENAVLVMADEGRAPARAGQHVLAGQGLEVLAGGSARLEYPDQTILQIGSDTELREFKAEGGKRVFVAKGTVRAEVSRQPQGRPMVFATPHGDSTVLGTTLRIVSDPDPKKGTRLEVEKGKVQLKNLAGKTVLVESGHFAVAAAGMECVARRMVRDALFVADSLPLNAADQAFLKRLEGLGFMVTLRVAKKLVPREDAQGKALVVISSSIHSTKDLAAREFNSIAVPVLTWEVNLFHILGMTGLKEGDDFGLAAGQTHVKILNANHFLSAGLSGAVPVTTRPYILKWAKVAPTALTIAAVEGDPLKAMIFAYEAGAALATGKVAPERRVGFFITDELGANLTKEGWALFDAAVRWSVEKQPVSAK